MRVRTDKSPTQFVRNGLRAAGVHVRSRAGKWNAIEEPPVEYFDGPYSAMLGTG